MGRNRARGVRIFLRKNIKFSIGNLNMKHGTLVISTKNLRHNIDIIVNYSFPNMDLAEFEAKMREIFRYTNTRKNTTLFCGDLNAKSYLWDINTSDHKGRIIDNLLIYSKLTCFNNGSPTYIVPNMRSSDIDVSFGFINGSTFKWYTIDTKIASIISIP